ncbi:MAG: hypothetical protein ACR2NC_03810 [Thermodesulfobacteriota bacterium]
MNQNNSSFRDTIDILVGVVPTLILYGNFIMIGLIFGIKDMVRFNNPVDQVFIISLGSLLGFAGLFLSFGRYSNRLTVIVNSILLITGIVTAIYVIISLYSEQDSPDSLLEKIFIAPLFASLIVGFKRLYLNIRK